MTAEEIKALPVAEKIQIMEAIWDDLRGRFERMELSPQLKELLDERRSRAQEGLAQLHDWDAVKSRIGKS